MKRFGKDSCELIGHAMYLLSVRCLQVQHGFFIGRFFYLLGLHGKVSMRKVPMGSL
jgi:hypothetical protein